MWVFDFDAPSDGIEVVSETALLNRLETVRRGNFGAFVLSTRRDTNVAPQLWIQINDAYSYIHFFDDVSGGNPGYQPHGMVLTSCPDEVRFIQIGESEAGYGNTMPGYTLCSLEDSYQAALEFFWTPTIMPSRINWVPLWIEE